MRDSRICAGGGPACDAAPIPGRCVNGLIPVDGRSIHIRCASQARIFSP